MEKEIKKIKDLYGKIGRIPCPAFNFELVHFTGKGFSHLLRKGHIPRPLSDQMRRLSLLKYAREIVVESTEFDTHRKGTGIEFWTLYKIFRNKKITVVISQIKGEPKKFFSIMDRKSKNFP